MLAPLTGKDAIRGKCRLAEIPVEHVAPVATARIGDIPFELPAMDMSVLLSQNDLAPTVATFTGEYTCAAVSRAVLAVLNEAP